MSQLFIKYFENFTIDKFKELEKEKKTYIKRLVKQNIEDISDYNFFLEKIRAYDISNFKYNDKPYDFWIKPDEFFIKILIDINKYLEIQIPIDLCFDFSYDPNNLNLIDFKKGIPVLLKNLGLGFKLYKFIIKKVNFLTTNYNSSSEAINVWRNLMLDSDLYCFTSNTISGVIYKYQSDSNIKFFLEKIKEEKTYFKYEFNKFIFDSELQKKIIQIYGSMDVYTQRN